MSTQLVSANDVFRFSRRRLLFGVVAVAAGGALAACSAGGTAVTAGAPAAQVQTAGQTTANVSGAAANATSTIHMTDQLKFDPATITIPVGSTIEWQNSSTTAHTVTDDPTKAQNKSDAVLPAGAEPWDSGMINPGQTYRRAFTVPGQYSYFCIPHETMGMVGQIVVQK